MGEYVEPKFRDNVGAYYVGTDLLDEGDVYRIPNVNMGEYVEPKFRDNVGAYYVEPELLERYRADLMKSFRDKTGYFPTNNWSTQELQFVLIRNKWPLGGSQKDYQMFNNKISKVLKRFPRRGGSKKRKNKISRRKKKSKYKKKKSRGKRKKMSKVSIKKNN